VDPGGDHHHVRLDLPAVAQAEAADGIAVAKNLGDLGVRTDLRAVSPSRAAECLGQAARVDRVVLPHLQRQADRGRQGGLQAAGLAGPEPGATTSVPYRS
jgi:hypothetical protein